MEDREFHRIQAPRPRVFHGDCRVRRTGSCGLWDRCVSLSRSWLALKLVDRVGHRDSAPEVAHALLESLGAQHVPHRRMRRDELQAYARLSERFVHGLQHACAGQIDDGGGRQIANHEL